MNTFRVVVVTDHRVKVAKARRNVNRNQEKINLVHVNDAKRKEDLVQIPKMKVVVAKGNAVRNVDALKQTKDLQNNNNHVLCLKRQFPQVSQTVIEVVLRLRLAVIPEVVLVKIRQRRKSDVSPVAPNGHHVVDLAQHLVLAVAADQSHRNRDHAQAHAANQEVNQEVDQGVVVVLGRNPAHAASPEANQEVGPRVAVVRDHHGLDHVDLDQKVDLVADPEVEVVVQDLVVEVKVDKDHQYPGNQYLQVQPKFVFLLSHFALNPTHTQMYLLSFY